MPENKFNKFDYLALVNADKRITHAELRVLLVIWRYADMESLEAYPSLNTVSKESGIGSRAAKRYLASLHEKGFLGVVKGGGGVGCSTVRKLTLPTLNSGSDNHGYSNHGCDNHGYSNPQTVVVTTPQNSGSDYHPNNQLIINNNHSMAAVSKNTPLTSTGTTVEDEKPRKRGTRLTENWKPSTKTIAWTLNQPNPTNLNPNEVFIDFQRYWISKTGQAATKLNWDMTWQRWWREQLKREKKQARYKNQNDLTTEMFATAAKYDQAQQNNNSLFDLGE